MRPRVERLLQDLSMNLTPADLRAAMFEALALLGNAEVLESDDSEATLAFAWEVGARSFETRIVIDTKRGLLLNMAELEYVDGTLFPSPVVLLDTTVSTSIVDAVATR